MKPHRECPLCIVSVRLNEVASARVSDDEVIEASSLVLEESAKAFRSEGELTRIASSIYAELVSRYPEVIEYYRIAKRKSIDSAKAQVALIKSTLNGLNGFNLFKAATRISIAGNLLDMGVASHKPPSELPLNSIMSMPFSIDHTSELYNMLSNGGLRVLWLFDNAGEALFDIILIDLIRSMGNIVIGAAKAEPGFQNDLTISDAEYAGLSNHLDELVSTGYAGSSIHLDKVSVEFLNRLKASDLVVAKGMAHFEYLSEVDLGKPTVFLLVPKCGPVAKVLGVEKGTLVAMLRQN
ncbi:damage-control phosphatase ARMT1 family protein [Caldivirga sp. UBA161]|uniref:damage-control phosphatase ARMT1 family protein n=1 Tax=Caldivirga sp. UBA161 TaxID=1915569 RepID=UPI0025BE9F52|nr:ARMT1-like domain-containing protein [Caldivirga sp. UBA161]